MLGAITRFAGSSLLWNVLVRRLVSPSRFPLHVDRNKKKKEEKMKGEGGVEKE